MSPYRHVMNRWCSRVIVGWPRIKVMGNWNESYPQHKVQAVIITASSLQYDKVP